MKKIFLVILSILSSVSPALAWDINELLQSKLNCASLIKPATEILQNSWSLLSPEQQKVALAIIALTACGIIYKSWPIKEQVALEKAKKCATQLCNDIDSGKITPQELKQQNKKETFKFGFPWNRKIYNVTARLAVLTMTDNTARTSPIVDIRNSDGEASLFYIQEGEKWNSLPADEFFKNIKRVTYLHSH